MNKNINSIDTKILIFLLLGKESLNNLEMEIYLFNRVEISTSILENFQKLAIRSKWLLSPLVCHMTVTISIGNHKTECPATKNRCTAIISET